MSHQCRSNISWWSSLISEKIAFKLLFLYAVGLTVNKDRHKSSKAQLRDNTRDDIHLHMTAMNMGSDLVCLELLPLLHVKIDPPVAAYTISLENKINSIICHPNVPWNLSDLRVLRCFKWP